MDLGYERLRQVGTWRVERRDNTAHGNGDGWKESDPGLFDCWRFLGGDKLMFCGMEQVACGFSHTVCLVDSTRDVYAWGSGNKGKLGTGDQINRYEPTLIIGLKRRNIKEIRSGAFFTLALSDKGNVYSWGANDLGQIGRRPMPEFEPGLIEELRSVKVNSR